MICQNCKNHFAPSLAVNIPRESTPDHARHCPVCLALLVDDGNSHSVADDSLNDDKRGPMRAQARETFLMELRTTANGEGPQCPVCSHSLSKIDLAQLQKHEHLRCGHCQHDLATLAYQRQAYDSAQWSSVMAATCDLLGTDGCKECRYVGAIASSCRTAGPRMPGFLGRYHKPLKRLLGQTAWSTPTGDCLDSCEAAKHYRDVVGKRLRVL